MNIDELRGLKENFLEESNKIYNDIGKQFYNYYSHFVYRYFQINAQGIKNIEGALDEFEDGLYRGNDEAIISAYSSINRNLNNMLEISSYSGWANSCDILNNECKQIVDKSISLREPLIREFKERTDIDKEISDSKKESIELSNLRKQNYIGKTFSQLIEDNKEMFNIVKEFRQQLICAEEAVKFRSKIDDAMSRLSYILRKNPSLIDPTQTFSKMDELSSYYRKEENARLEMQNGLNLLKEDIDNCEEISSQMEITVNKGKEDLNVSNESEQQSEVTTNEQDKDEGMSF